LLSPTPGSKWVIGKTPAPCRQFARVSRGLPRRWSGRNRHTRRRRPRKVPFVVSGAVPQSRHPFVLGAVGTAVNDALFLHSMPDHSAAAMGANRRQRLDGTFEGIENMLAAAHRHGERLVVLVLANVALSHGDVLLI